MPEETAATKSSEDATQVNAPDHEDEVQATTPITESRIILSMAATKVIVKERLCTASVVWRNMTSWNDEHETDKCWREVKNILMGELVIGVPTTFVSENHGYMPVHRRIDLASSGSVATSIECVQTAQFQHKDRATNQTGVVRWRDDGKTQLAQRNEMEPTGIRMEVKQQTC